VNFSEVVQNETCIAFVNSILETEQITDNSKIRKKGCILSQDSRGNGQPFFLLIDKIFDKPIYLQYHVLQGEL
jgi:hypothetical protein